MGNVGFCNGDYQGLAISCSLDTRLGDLRKREDEADNSEGIQAGDGRERVASLAGLAIAMTWTCRWSRYDVLGWHGLWHLMDVLTCHYSSSLLALIKCSI